MVRSTVPTPRPAGPQTTPTWPFIGQESLGVRLLSAIKSNQLPPAILFLGPSQLGKHSAALWLTSVDLCKASNDHPCGQCPACRQILAKAHPFVRELQGSAETPIQIDDVRKLMADTHLRLPRGQRAWMIISDIEWLTEGAANAWLKWLEEPPAGIHCLLTSSVPDRVSPTLRSRCAVFYWHLVGRQRLKQSLQPSSFGSEPRIARAAGRPGQLRRMEAWPEEQATEQQSVREYLGVLTSQDPEILARLLEEAAAAPEQTFKNWQLALRELLLARIGSQQRRLWPDLKAEIDRFAESWTVNELLKRIERTQSSFTLLERHVAPKHIAPELLLV